jgi:hypothetical protein
MSIQFSILFGVCIALAIPLLVLSAPTQEAQEEMIEDVNNVLDRLKESNHHNQQPLDSLIHDDESNDNDHFMLKKAADFEQILKPCNRIPATGRHHEYTDCVRNRMLLMGRRKRSQES